LYNWSAPNLSEKFRTCIDGIEIGPLTGSCGTAAFKKEKVVVADIEQDPLWANYKEIAKEKRKGLLVLSHHRLAQPGHGNIRDLLQKSERTYPGGREYTGKSKRTVDDHLENRLSVEE